LKTPFGYRLKESFIHRLNPLTKLVLSLSLVVVAFLMPDYKGPLLITLMLLGIAAWAGIFWKLLKITLSIAALLAVMLLGIHGLFYPGNQTPLVVVGPVTFWQEGLLYALRTLFRLLVLICASLISMLTTNPKEMMIVLTKRGLSPKLAYVLTASVQFVPEMRRRAQAIAEAQQARGLDIKANLWRRFRALIAMMVPLLAGALIAAETRSLALEARGFSRKGERTYLLDVPDSSIDRLLRWVAVVAVLVAVLWRVAAWA
jgi:energy-coupling factor transport system permease protein